MMNNEARNNTASVLNNLGITHLYHLTNIENLQSILHNRGISSWKRAVSSEINVPFPGGDYITHRLESRSKYRRDEFVHVYPSRPSALVVDRFINTGRHKEMYAIKISTDIIREDNVVFWIGEPDDEKSRRIINIDEFEEVIRNNPEVINQVTMDIKDFVPYKYLQDIPKSYTAKISEIHPTAIFFIIDQSCSMARSTNIDDVEYDYISELAAEVVNMEIEALLGRCVSEEGDISHLYDIGVIAYGDNVRSGWNGNDRGKYFLTPIELLAHVKGPDDKYRWVEPRDDDRRGRCDLALDFAYEILSEWMNKQESEYYYPPTIIHITDGEVKRDYQNDFLLNAERLKGLQTATSNVVFWNLGLVSDKRSERLFPSGEDLPALINPRGALILYEASSYLPHQFKEKAALIHGGDPSLNRRTMGINALKSNITQMLQLCILPD